MKKELFFAIAAGAILGLIIAFGIWRVNSSLSLKDNKAQITSSPVPYEGFSLTLANVNDQDVITQEKINLSGITKPNSFIALSAEENDYLLTSKEDGTFEKEIKLISGLNEIVLKVFDQGGNSSEKILTLVYSSEFAKNLKNPIPFPEEKQASEEADTVREKVQQKVEEALKNPKAYLGTVTDIMEKTFQVKNSQGEIQQVATDEETTFVKIDKTSKQIKFSDIAIGDYIMAMGFKNGNSVLEAKRVLVTQTPKSTDRKILMGKVAKVSKASILIAKLPANDTIEIALTANSDILVKKDGVFSKTKLTSIKEGNIIFAFGKEKENSFEARTVIIKEEPIPSPTASLTPKE